jgi:hypothetical protein
MTREEAVERCLQAMDTHARTNKVLARVEFTLEDTGTEVMIFQRMYCTKGDAELTKVGIRAAYDCIEPYEDASVNIKHDVSTS